MVGLSGIEKPLDKQLGGLVQKKQLGLLGCLGNRCIIGGSKGGFMWWWLGWLMKP